MASRIDALPPAVQKKARKAAQPSWTPPMLAKLTHDYFSDEAWVYERKLDGERVLAFVDDNGRARLMTRNQKQVDDSYPEIQEALEAWAANGCIFDGEMVAFNRKNVSDFQKLQQRMHSSRRAASRKSGIRVYYYLFDCLYVDGHDITGCPLRSRKKILKATVAWKDPLRWTQHRNTNGLEYHSEACRKGWEGLIAKHAGSAYVHSRSSNWLKFKCLTRQEFVIGGFTEPQGERVGFGALLLGFYRKGRFVYAGKVGTGFEDETLRTLAEQLNRIQRRTSPYDQGDPKTDRVHFVTPKIVCEIAFTEWTRNNRLRHPRFKGLRRDKRPHDVHKEVERQKS